MSTILNIGLDSFISSYPTGASLLDDEGKVIDSDYCNDIEEFVEFAKRNKEHIDEETCVCISVSIDDIDSTAVLDFGNEVAREIKKAILE